jgi:hypothetical protein
MSEDEYGSGKGTTRWHRWILDYSITLTAPQAQSFFEGRKTHVLLDPRVWSDYQTPYCNNCGVAYNGENGSEHCPLAPTNEEDSGAPDV